MHHYETESTSRLARAARCYLGALLLLKIKEICAVVWRTGPRAGEPAFVQRCVLARRGLAAPDGQRVRDLKDTCRRPTIGQNTSTMWAVLEAPLPGEGRRSSRPMRC